MFNLSLSQLIDDDHLAELIVRGADETEDVFDLIVFIDETMGDWDFSERLYQYFKVQHKEYKRVTKED